VKIAHFSDTSEPSRNGIATSLQTLTYALVGLGCKCLTVSPSVGWAGSYENDHWRLPSFPSGLADIRLATGSRRRKVQRVMSWQPDVIHVHTPGPVGLLGTMVSKRLDIPLVHTYHTDLYSYANAYRVPTWIMRLTLITYLAGLSELAQASAVLRGDRQLVIDDANRTLLSEADVIVLPTSAALRRRSLPVDMDTVRFIPTAPRMPATTPNAARIAFRSRFQVSATSSKVVLFVGRVSAEKNIPLLLDAFRELLSFDNSATLVLVGPVFKKRQFGRTLRRAGIEGRVIITGPLSPEYVWQAYSASDVFAFPSLTDSQGVVLDEAALAGLPIVLTDANLYHAHPLSAVMRLTEPEPRDFAEGIIDALSSRLNLKATDGVLSPRATRYTPEQFAAKVLEAYDSAIIARSKRSSGNR
jgi:1,2-diacylglycerol 3-alpha-glucosyltransferase